MNCFFKIQKPNFIFLLFIVFVYFLLDRGSATAISSPPYTPTDNILINCGSNDQIAVDGRHWTGDLENSTFSPKGSSITVRANPGSVVPVPYSTGRISQSPFTYSVPVTPGQKFLRLYFYPQEYPSNRAFDVKAGPYTLVRNFSAARFSDAWPPGYYDAFVREFCINVEENQQLLNITFGPSLENSIDSYAYINGIEIVSMPTNLYYTPPEGPGIPFIGRNETYYVRNDTALQKILRLNVGGSSISPADDTGMYRTWNDDWIFYATRIGVWPSKPNVPLNHSKTPPYVAPDYLYRSARYMGPNSTVNLLKNMTWQAWLDPGFMYLIRLHFCEMFDQIKDVRFAVLIGNKTAEASLDVVQLAGGLYSPVYKDYIFMVGQKGGAQYFSLHITLHPKPYGSHANATLNGLEVFKLSNSNLSLSGLNAESTFSSAPDSPTVEPLPERSEKKILLIAIIGGAAGLLTIVSSLCCVVIWRQKKKERHGSCSYCESLSCRWCLRSQGDKSSRTRASSLPDELCHHFTLDEVKAATNNFDVKLIIGEGGFGNVYKGDFGDGFVAIKRLNPESRQGAHEFKTEIKMLSQLRHVHLVSLIGYCNDGGEMILVYDFMVNGTLQQHLHGSNFDPLPWRQRLQICVGAARGLHYLHSGVTHTIIHRDVKSTNILLDENWIAKVSDFGLSRAGLDKNGVSTLVKGTMGYLDPEYARCSHLTDKSDVFSFGVVLFEVLCARKPVDRKLEDQDQWSLVNWARKCIQNGTIHEIIDPHLKGKIAPECFNRFVEIAESCLREHGTDRPTMHDVMEKLDFALRLQQDADTKQEATNPGGEHIYPDQPYQPPAYTSFVNESHLDSSTASGLTTFTSDTTGMTYPSLESSSVTTSHGFSDTTNSAANAT